MPITQRQAQSEVEVELSDVIEDLYYVANTLEISGMNALSREAAELGKKASELQARIRAVKT